MALKGGAHACVAEGGAWWLGEEVGTLQHVQCSGNKSRQLQSDWWTNLPCTTTALVKLLRKCVRELASRTSCFVDQAARIERESCKQVQSIQLTSESTLRSVEAELAGAKKDLAQYEAMFKTDKAKWGADLEDQR